MERYAGTKLPSWVSAIATFLPGLVSIELSVCKELQHLSSSLSQLCHLKCLKLWHMTNVEYIESDVPSPSAKFFPSLENLVLEYMPKLKGWWRDISWMKKEASGVCLVDGTEQAAFLPPFPHLRELTIHECKRLTYFPPCPHVKMLVLTCINEALTFCMKGGVVQSPVPSTITASSSLSSNVSVAYTLQRLTIDNSWVFNSLFREFVGGAVCIKLLRMNILGFTKEGFQSCTSSFRDLVIFNCSGLENLAAIGIEQFTNLKSLEFSACDENLEGMPWKFLHSLLFLTISCHPELVNLPKGLQHLTSLQSLRMFFCHNLETLGECLNSLTSLQVLQIERCFKLKSLPEAMRHLTSLTKLEIIMPSPELKDRCRKPDGEDWPKICHIPHLHISSGLLS
ncbi:uncharacterized protein [Spinacia oleracea]|nr:uncharacterized protein LOC110774909 isoform X2 [Spinacia oleracea]